MKNKKIVLIVCMVTTIFFAGCGEHQQTINAGNESNAAETVSETEETDKQNEISTEETVSEATETVTQDETEDTSAVVVLEDGTYLADFDTDSSMFHVNEACDGKAVLTVEDGQMLIHLIMPSKNIINLYLGLEADAVKEGAELINPTMEEVTYSDGLTEEVHAFDVPVPVIGEEFDLALIGTKGKWYDHKVVVSNPEPVTE